MRRSIASFTPTGWLISLPLLLVMGYFIFFPVAKVLLLSFTNSATGLFPTFEYYAELLDSARISVVFKNTAIAVLGSVTMAVAVASILAWSIARTDLPFARYLGIVPMVPLLLPALVSAIGWSVLFSPRSGYINVLIRWVTGLEVESGPFDVFTLGGVTITMGLYLIPYAYSLLYAAFASYDPALDEASRVMGSSLWKTFFRVSLPVVKPALLGATFLCVTVALAQFAIPAVLGAPGRIDLLSTLIYRYVRGYPARIELGAAISTVLAVVAVCAHFAMIRALRRGGHATIGGKGASTKPLPLGRWRYPLAGFIGAYLVIAVALPLLANILSSLTTYTSVEALRPDRLTLNNYRFILFEHPYTWVSMRNSFFLAGICATIGALLGALIGYIVARRQFVGHRVIGALAVIPAVIPGIVIGVGLLEVFINPPLVLYGSVLILVVAYVVHFLPYAVRATDVSLRQIGTELEEASRVFGSSWGRTAVNVVLPLIRPGLISAWSLLALLILRELPISSLLTTPGTNVMAVLIYNLTETETLPRISAFSIVLVVISLVTLIGVRGIARRWGTGSNES